MGKAEELRKYSKDQLIEVLLSMEGDEAVRVVGGLLERECDYFFFYQHRIENIGLDLIDESFGDPLDSSVCEDVVLDLVSQIKEKVTGSKSGCKLLIELYNKSSLVIPYAPNLEKAFEEDFTLLFSSYAKTWHKRDRLMECLFTSIVNCSDYSLLPLLKIANTYLNQKEIHILVNNLNNFPKQTNVITSELETLVQLILK